MSEPEWIAALRTYAGAHGQKAAGAKIGYSNGLVSAVLKGTYTADLKAVQQAVEGALLGAVVDCPVIGEMPRNLCREHQLAEFSTANPLRVQLARACPTCPNRRAAS